MHKIYLLLGSNEGDCLTQIGRAFEEIKHRIGNVKSKSSIYKSEPWGFKAENFFFNQVILVETKYSPEEVLNVILKIEEELGRIRHKKGYESRSIDIDILFYDNLIINTEKLKIPHPLIALRRFTLLPLNEIAAGFLHPITSLTMNEILKCCEDNLKVFKYNEGSTINSKISQNT